MKTDLKDRVLFYDGTNLVDPDYVPELLLTGIPLSKIRVTEIDDEVRQFNMLSDDVVGAGEPTELQFDHTWKIPKQYLAIDLGQFLMDVLDAKFPGNTAYADRLALEVAEIDKRGLHDLFRTLIYVVDTFKEKKVVWGVGRGSSCASLVLFLIGVHKVDPVKFGISASEFFHD